MVYKHTIRTGFTDEGGLPTPDFFSIFNPANDVAESALPLPASSRGGATPVSLYKDQTLSDPTALYEQGRRLLEERHYDQAIALFNHLLGLNPDNPDALNNLAFCLLATGRAALALKTYSLARYLIPQDTEILRGIANCHETLGNFSQAIELYEAVLAREPENVDCLYNLVLIGNYTPDAPIARQLHRLHASPHIAGGQRILACFALAKLYEAQDDYRRSFAYYEEGNRLKFSSLAYDEATMFRYIDALEAAYDERFFAASGDTGICNAAPIFVLGMPRAGTTLVEQMLASHPLVHGAGELHTLPDIITRLIPQLTGQLDPRTIRHIHPRALASFAELYLNVLRSHCPEGKAYIVDKMPNNFFNIGLIRLLLPRAKIIHCVRDPMDTCWSLYRQHFNGAHHYSYDQISLGRFHLRYQQLMRHWHRVLPGAIHDVHYEQLVQNPRQTMAGLLRHCGMPWDDKCLAFYKTERSISTASMRQVRQPLYKSSLRSWLPVAEKLADLHATLYCR